MVHSSSPEEIARCGAAREKDWVLRVACARERGLSVDPPEVRRLAG